MSKAEGVDILKNHVFKQNTNMPYFF